MEKQKIELNFSSNCFYKLLTINKAEYYDYIFNDNIAFKLPVGEVFLSIIDSTPLLNQIVINKDDEYCNEIIKFYFSNRVYDFSSFYYDFSKLPYDIQIKQYEGILKINDFIAQCCNDKSLCNFSSLNSLIIDNSEFDNTNLLEKLFLINSDLIDKTIEFENLLELVVISLYSIIKAGFKLYRCHYCNGYFIANATNTNKKTCERKLEINKYYGCNNARIIDNLNKRNNKDYMKTYKRIYARLAMRASKGTYEDVQKSNHFREEWRKLWRETKPLTEKEKSKILLKFLNSKEFN